MKRSIFSPLMWLSLTIIIVSAIVLGSVHLVLINKYIISSKTNALLESAEGISDITAWVSSSRSPQLESLFKNYLNRIAQGSDFHIIITNTEGFIIAYSDELKTVLKEPKISIKDFTDVLNGQNVYKIGALNSVLQINTFTAAVPVTISGKVEGVVLVSSPVPELYRDRQNLFSMLATSVLISSAIAFLLSLIISRWIIRPIRSLSSAAHDIAKGHYSKRVEISSIAELAELGEAFNRMAAAIGQHEEVRINFIGNVSHDLRTPMTTISGFVEGILDGTIPEEQKNAYLEIVLRETRRLSRLVNTFLDISRYEEDASSLTLTKFDINEMIRLVLVSLEARIQEKNLNVSFELSEENTFVQADENEIHRVVMNLLDNAVKFAGQNGTVQVVVAKKGAKALVSITNSGAAISDEDARYIWDRFYKADKARSSPDKGFGLGLFIVKSILQRHGEAITLDNRPDQTTFSFTLTRIS